MDHGHSHQSHPGAMLVAFGAAAAGIAARSLESVHPLFGAGPHWPSSPDELFAWAKAIANSAFTLVNAGVGCWHLISIGHTSIKRRTDQKRRRKPTPPSGPAPHTESDGGDRGTPA